MEKAYPQVYIVKCILMILQMMWNLYSLQSNSKQILIVRNFKNFKLKYPLFSIFLIF